MYGHHDFDLFEAIYTTRSMRRLKPIRWTAESDRQSDRVRDDGSERAQSAAVDLHRRHAGSEAKEFRRRSLSQSVGRRLHADRARSRRQRSAEPARTKSALGEISRRAYRRRARDDLRVREEIHRPRARRSADVGRDLSGDSEPVPRARGYGLGTSITGMHTMFAKEIDALLGVPPEYANVVLIPMGYPKGRWARPDRKPALAGHILGKMGHSPRRRPRLNHASITASTELR